jgi:peptide/nickel transport system substrate-binding protein
MRGSWVSGRRVVAAVCVWLWVAPVPLWGQAIRFCPGDDAPVAYNPATNAYEEGYSFDPLICAEEPCLELLHNIFEPLVMTSPTQAIKPWLATAWQRLDPVTFRFTLRRGVTFHNGEPFDAETVRFSLQRASQLYGATAWFPEIMRVEVLAPYTVEVVLRQPDSLFLYRLGQIGLMLPPRYWQDVGPEAFGARPVGTGAYQFVRWDGALRQVHLRAHPGYWRPGYPRVPTVVYAYMDAQRAFDMLARGELDLIRRLNPRKTTAFMQTGAGKVVKAWLPHVVVGLFNLLKPETPLRQLAVREAINLSVQRDHVIRFGTIGNGRLLGGYTVPNDPNHVALPPYPLDVPLAQQRLQEAGYAQGLTLSVLVDKQVPPQIENIIAGSLQQIGIELTVKRASESEFLQTLYLPKFTTAAVPPFDILLLSIPVGAMFHSAMIPMSVLYSKEPNESSLRDPLLDQLYEQALHAAHPGAAAAGWQALERYVYKHHLLLMGYQEKAIFGSHRHLRFTPRTLMTFWDADYDPVSVSR